MHQWLHQFNSSSNMISRRPDLGPGPVKSLLIQMLLLCCVLVAGPKLRADLLFEGYYKVISAGVPVGFYVQNYEYDEKTKQFISRYYLRTNQLGGSLAESLVAKSDQKFFPISYEYTGNVAGKIKTIDAKFRLGKAEPVKKTKTSKTKISANPPATASKGDQMIMTATVSENGGKPNVIEKKLPSGTFLSTFLGYLMLQKGITSGIKFDYVALAEEDGETSEGQAMVKENVKMEGIDGYRVLNIFKGSNFTSTITNKGEILNTKSPAQQISTELVAVPSEATSKVTFDQNTLRLVFGKMPEGTKNILAQKQKEKLNALLKPTKAKESGE